VELFNEGQYDKAITYFKDSHVLDCAEMDSLSQRRNYSAEWLAYCFYKTGNIDEAKKYNKICYKSKPIDRRLTVRIDSLSAEATRDFMKRNIFGALKKTDEVDSLENLICKKNSFFHVGTYQMKANCYGTLQKLDSALYYLQKVRKIEEIYFEKFDTLFVGTLNGLFYLNLNLHQYDAAK
jgi:tetratricopeptide (TPR) repeat protein